MSEIGLMHVTGPLQWAGYLLFPFLVVQLWFLSTFRVFRYDSGGWMFVGGLTLELVCLVHKVGVVAREVEVWGDVAHHLQGLFRREKVMATGGNIFAVCYYCLGLGAVEVGSSRHLLLFLLDLMVIVYKYLVLEEIYSMIRIEVIGSRYKLFMNLFDLATNVFLMIHVFVTLPLPRPSSSTSPPTPLPTPTGTPTVPSTRPTPGSPTTSRPSTSPAPPCSPWGSETSAPPTCLRSAASWWCSWSA